MSVLGKSGKSGKSAGVGKSDETDLAGGQATTHPGGALATSRDGVVGYWDTKTPPVKKQIDAGKLDYLRPGTRAHIIDHELFLRFRVVDDPGHGDGSASFFICGTNVTIVRPTDHVLRRQLTLVKAYADLREDRLPEIVEQVDDILSFFGALTYLDDHRDVTSIELLNAAIRSAQHVEYIVKHFCHASRPIDFAREVMPVIQTPDSGTFPAGHACEAFAVATVLHSLLVGQAGGSSNESDDVLVALATPSDHNNILFRLAHRIAENRIVAGVHFPVDCVVGAALGVLIGRAIAGSLTGAVFKAPLSLAQTDGNADFTLDAVSSLLTTDHLQDVEVLRSDLLATFLT